MFEIMDARPDNEIEGNRTMTRMRATTYHDVSVISVDRNTCSCIYLCPFVFVLNSSVKSLGV